VASETVAVQVVGALTGSVEGLQFIETELCLWNTEITVVPVLEACIESPE
jgi:hypothetical protein